MAFLNKQQVEKYASIAHLDLTGLTWQQKQKAISDHMKRGDIKDPMEVIGGDKQAIVDDRDAEIAKLKAELEKAKAEQEQGHGLVEDKRIHLAAPRFSKASSTAPAMAARSTTEMSSKAMV